MYVERERALFGSWYEFFPRSEGAIKNKDGSITSGNFKTAIKSLERVSKMGFDVLYLPPIHPIGSKFRKGKNNSLTPDTDDPGVPWAIGSEFGGHDTVNPELGTIKDFEEFVKAANKLNIEVALDFALQVSPDHPWVSNHPEWFTTRPDGSIAYAENPPKKYQDIYPINFDKDYSGIKKEVVRILSFWIEKGIKIFRVDNPHTKPVIFWQEVIAEINSKNQFISFPSTSNFKLEQGSLESWVIPEWNGIDNLSNLTFKISKENLPIKSNQIFIGASEYHPILDSNNYFTINKKSNVKGKPNLNKDGVFIYYDADPSGLFDRWYLQIVDGYVGNSFDAYHPNYSIQIDSDGIFYDVKSLDYPKPSNINFTTGVNTLKINGGSILGGDTKVDVSRSSQFASAIMLIGPFLKNGLRLKLIGDKFVSRSYITMTLKILELAGVEVAAMGNYIEIPNQRVAPPDFEVECDWSSAAFWYQYVAHYKSAKINLSGLSRSGIQGDECMADFFKQLGVRTTQDNRSIIIEYDPSFLSIGQLQFDLADVPDLAPALILTCFGERIPAVFTGINHLQFKESDRIKSIASCINSLGGEMKVVDDAIILNDFPESFNSVIVNPFNDHRIAMAMAMFSATGTSVTLSDQNVVNKSYPEFWSHIELFDLPVTLV